MSLIDLVSLQGRTALVTGAGGGIGAAVVTRLAEAGAAVVGTDLPGKSVPEVAESIACDIGDEADIAKLVGLFEARRAGPHIFVHCAGIFRDALIWKMQPRDWSRVLAVNLDSAFLLLRGLAPLMREAGDGRVVLITSINGERGKRGQANYAASKAGLIALAKTAARELGMYGIRVNAVAPGFVATPMTAGLPHDVAETARRESALGRIAEPDDVARAVLFLASDLSRHVTGQVLRVDGGQLIA